MTSALDAFRTNARVAELLWQEHQRALANYNRARRDNRRGSVAFSVQFGEDSYLVHQALVQAAAVRLATSWEIFLRGLLSEYFRRRPDSFRRFWKLSAESLVVSDDTCDVVSDVGGRPFQDIDRASNLLRSYLGDDLFSAKKNVFVDLTPVKDLLVVRNAVVHAGGIPTQQFRRRLKTRKAAHAYLVSRPGPVGSLPATQFERIMSDLLSTANALYTRAWQRPRPQFHNSVDVKGKR